MSAVGLDYVLKDTDIPALSEVLAPICNKWKTLGNALELPNFLIVQCRDDDSLFLAMNGIVREWIAGNGVTPITLGTLKQKLEGIKMGEKVFAEDLIANFNKVKFPGASPPEAAPPGCGAASPNLTIADLAKVLEEVNEAKAKWLFIGLQLGISSGELTGIESDGNGADEKLVKMLTKWLNSGKNTTWKALADAMGSKSVQLQALQSAILANHPC